MEASFLSRARSTALFLNFCSSVIASVKFSGFSAELNRSEIKFLKGLIKSNSDVFFKGTPRISVILLRFYSSVWLLQRHFEIRYDTSSLALTADRRGARQTTADYGKPRLTTWPTISQLTFTLPYISVLLNKIVLEWTCHQCSDVTKPITKFMKNCRVRWDCAWWYLNDLIAPFYPFHAFR